MIADIMSIFQPSMKNLEKVKERKLSHGENSEGAKGKAQLDQIIKDGLSPSSFKDLNNKE